MARSHIAQLLITLVLFLESRFQNAQECEAPANPHTETCDDEEMSLHRKPMTNTHSSSGDSDRGCTLYIAESSIEGAGLGIFTAIERGKGDKIGNGDVCIPFLDLYWHNDVIEPNPFKDYYWAGHAMGMHTETDSEDIEAYCPGLDCAINCHLGLVNIEKSNPEYFRDAGGSSSPYHTKSNVVSRRIPAGGELFKFYGDSWFVSRERIFGKIPLTASYGIALKLLKKLVALSSDSEVLEDFFYIVRRVNRGVFESRQLNAFPPTWEQVQEVLKVDDMSVWQQSQHIRSVEWLRENGRCIDSIRPGISAVAERGAFSTRSFSAGEIITTSPLHHLPDKSILNIYNFTKYKGDWARVVDQNVGYQLILNYCWGHESSTLLLCPYGSGVNLINHKQEPNVKIQWATGFTVAHDHDIVSQGSIEDSFSGDRPVVAFDYVALADVVVGEELFIDYGDKWQEAWSEHINSDHPARGVVSASIYNELMAALPIPDEEEQKIDPYPDNLQMRCHSSILLLKPSKGLDHRGYGWRVSDYGEACRVLERFWEDNAYWYTVEFEVWPKENIQFEDDKKEQEKVVFQTIRTDVPRSAIRFFDIPGTTQLHSPDAFRHHMKIPDGMFPKQWRTHPSV